VLARCLEQDPSKRPPSAYSILAALPGGDPLAAALAAGEIPSLELVADSGGDKTLPVLPAILSLLTVMVAVLGVAHLQGRLLKPLTQPKAVLTAQADVLFEELTGKEPPRFSASGFLRQSPDSTLGANSEKLPSSEAFWKIWSSNTLLSKDFHYGGINETALGRLTLGETGMIITMDGELRGFRFVHPDTIGWELPDDHSGVFEAMNLNPSDYRQVTNQGIVKWKGAGGNGDPTEITAQYMSGNLSSITTTGPQIRTEPLLHPPLSRPEIPFFAVILTQLIPLVVSLLFAWRNVRLGRADFRGATTFASIVVVGYLLQWVFLISLNEMSLGTALTHLSAGAPFGHALVHGVSVWFAYLAVEPFMRRIRPGSLTSWVRLVDHRWRDALIGRDILAGLVIGSLTLLFYILIAHVLAPSFPNALGKMIIVSAGIGGMSGSLAPLFYAIAWAPTLILLSLVLFLLLRLIVRRDRIAIAAFFLVGGIISLYYFLNPADLTVAGLLAAAIFGGITLLFTLLRFGVLAAVIYGFVIVLGQAPWSLDFGAWYGPMSMLSPAVVILFALWAAFIAVGDRVSAVLEES
ncbi:MAG: hypothetical protein HKN21_03960, partial [Candidatus Eisenbacteria bacterium]|nr:hypothetical protein [Candidatus Eisenbacteria bacterium]